MSYDGDFESYSDGAGAHQQGLDLWEFRITAHMVPGTNVDIDGLLKALVEMCRAAGANGIGYGAERLRVPVPPPPVPPNHPGHWSRGRWIQPETNAPRSTSAPKWWRP